MKQLIIFLICILVLINEAYTQATCPVNKILTPAVVKATDLEVELINCSTLVVRWQGVPDQDYIATAIRRDTTTNIIDSIAAASSFCDFAQKCKATFNVSSGTRVRWIVQASRQINSRTFYSYIATNDLEYAIPGCADPLTNFPPVAGAWLVKFYTPSSVLLAAWGSYDPEGLPLTYSWRKVSGPDSYEMLYGNSATPVISQLVNGIYGFELMVTDAGGASATDTINFTVTDVPRIMGRTNALQENAFNQHLSRMTIFPNPATDNITLQWSSDYSGGATLTVMDFSGKSVKTLQLQKQNTLFNKQVNVRELKQGMYYLFIKMADGRVTSGNFYKN